MGRFESLSYSPYETRRVLRDRLRRTLRPANERPELTRFPASPITDAELLLLLRRVRIHHGSDAGDVRATYDTYRKAHPSSPTFDNLIDDGWFGIAWGRITHELGTRSSIKEQDEPLRSGLQDIFDSRRHDTFTFDDVSDLSQPAQALAAHLVEHPDNIATIRAPSCDWIAARLWEQRPTDLSDTAALRWWVDRWILLGRPRLAPNAWWTDRDARAWRHVAMDVLQREAGLVTWDVRKR